MAPCTAVTPQRQRGGVWGGVAGWLAAPASAGAAQRLGLSTFSQVSARQRRIRVLLGVKLSEGKRVARCWGGEARYLTFAYPSPLAPASR